MVKGSNENVGGGGRDDGQKQGRQYWAAGTGYGHSGAAGEKWDVEAYLAAQREQDRLKEDLLEVHEMMYDTAAIAGRHRGGVT